jgi:hypothetical protein
MFLLLIVHEHSQQTCPNRKAQERATVGLLKFISTPYSGGKNVLTLTCTFWFDPHTQYL